MIISIIIRTKNEEESIGKTLDKVLSSKIDQPFEVILVDSGSSDKTLEIAKQFDVKILTIPESKFTFGYSLNYGIQNSSGDIICCLSAHCIPCDDNWLSELIKPIAENKAHATYGRQAPVKGMNPFEELFLNKHFPADGKPDGRIAFSNANCAFVRKLWDETKFDEHVPGWEDYLWYLQSRDRFTFQYVPAASVTHSHRFSMRRTWETAYRDGRALRYIEEKYGLDILGNISSVSGKLKYATNDMLSNIIFFLRHGYLGYIPLMPVVKLYSYLNYRKGYNNTAKTL